MFKYNFQGIFGSLPPLALLFGFLALPFMIWEHYGSSLLMGIQRIRTYNYYQVIGRTVTVAAVLILLVFLGLGVQGVLQANLLGQIVVAIGGVGILTKFAHARKQAI